MQSLNSLILCLVIGSSCALSLENKVKAAGDEQEKLREALKVVEPCFLQSIYTYNRENLLPPTTTDNLKKACKRQTEGFKCLKDTTRNPKSNLPSIIRRGLNSYALTRQRYHKKFCSNVNSELSQKFLIDMKCILEKKRKHYIQAEIDILKSLTWVDKKNFSDPAIELKHICCSLVNYRRSLIDGALPECPSSKQTVEELTLSIISNDMNLICEDEEKLLKQICPNLPPMDIDKFVTKKDIETASATAIGLYLIATLGE